MVPKRSLALERKTKVQGTNHVKKMVFTARKRVLISTTKEDTDILLLPSEREKKTRISTILRVSSYKIGGWNRNRQNAFFNSDIAIVH